MSEFVIDKKAMRQAFSRAAEGYDASAVLQREVCTRMLERLEYIKLQPERLLDAGSGTGWGGRQLAEKYPAAQVISLDIAIGMLQTSKSRSSWWQKLFGGCRQLPVCADVEALPLAANSLDMVWSNLAVQWCNDLPATFVELHRVLKTEGLLMFSTLGPDTLKELRQAFKGVDERSHLNRFADMHDIGDMLVQAGFAEPVMDMEYLTLTYEDVRGVLQDLKAIGAHNTTAGRGQGLMGKAAWARLLENYEKLRRDGKLPATYEVVYGHAWKPAPRVNRDGAAIIKTSFKIK
ncbi:MAG TPA: malonyl-[acyl-carrier protein] O-methyltransferase BioC [Gallionella sp.]|nr:malonyl-ACP O-methyltransferase BioC [Gallionella sp.]OGS66415.1 MAG: malonyl-[acyl-carrier protein] O-methyltransferase BioC [Gallionellales bacterium GWA2_54_124]OGT18618.1 MAG: malonyl-[acyl-carrier protein] O-methyltransferase BioC [Gallionellales bacterium RIFOXYD12_FULL_53_10]HCI52618.1 malonyl-[acyl-carrier protein] O-methyltransferase BioC [Gallionella sp.]